MDDYGLIWLEAVVVQTILMALVNLMDWLAWLAWLSPLNYQSSDQTYGISAAYPSAFEFPVS